MGEVLPTRTPVEALVFRYSAAFVGSLYAWWLALLATALCLWRARSCRAATAAGSSDPAVLPLASTPVDVPSSSSPASICRFESSDLDGGGTPKGRFRVYFNVDDLIIGEEEEAADGEKAATSDSGFECGWEESRTAELGWYSYQCRTALNGSVVRLWDRERWSPAESPRKRVTGRLAVEW